MNEKFLKVDDVMQILGISKSAAYNIMRQLNNELKEKGYALKNAMAADLFPRCAHVETICLLIRE